MDIVSKRAWFFLFSAVLILPGIISLIIPPALNAGIEFSSGSAMDLTFTRAVTEDEIRGELTRLGHPEARIQKKGQRSVFIRTKVLEQTVIQDDGSEISEQALIENALANIAPIESREFDSVSPILAKETVFYTIVVVLLATIGILIYVTWAFRRIPNSFRYGVSAVLALVHDMLFVLGIFSILGKVMDMEVNGMFIAGLLTVLGYSVNDTIVVFDRIRENVARNIDRPLAGVINASILESLGRSLNTSLTSLFVLLALLLFGGPTIRGLLLVLTIGVVAGTYSSVCIASQFLVMWDQGELRRALRFMRLVPARSG